MALNAWFQEVRRPRRATFPASRLDQITMMAESGGNPNAVSPRGARGLMQVMPETARDPGFGIRPSNGSRSDDVRVGREYRAEMDQRYGGDPAKMWAAYNWGPGNLDSAIARYGDRWLDHAPAETRNYVRNNLRQLRGR
jgi:soluble lytic murein transglycosylase